MTYRRTIGAALSGCATLATGQAEDLKLEREGVRVWLSRMTEDDGADPLETVTIEARVYPQPGGAPEWHVVAACPAFADMRSLDSALGSDPYGCPAMLAGELARIIKAELKQCDTRRP